MLKDLRHASLFKGRISKWRGVGLVFLAGLLLLAVWLSGLNTLFKVKPALLPAEEISFAVYSYPQKFTLDNVDMTSDIVLQPLHMGLLTSNYKGELFSGAAKSWTVSDDRLEYIFYLDTDLTFHNGKKLTCQDVAYIYQKIMDGALASSLNDLIETIGCDDEHTFRVRLTMPSSLFLSGIVLNVVVPAGQNVNEDTFIGLGPYRFVSKNEDSILLAQQDPNFQLSPWSAKRLRIKVYKSVIQAMEAFKKGEVDIVKTQGFVDTAIEQASLMSLFPNRLWLVSFGDLLDQQNVTPDVLSCLNQRLDRNKIVATLNAKTPQTFDAAYGVISPTMPGYFEPPYLEMSGTCLHMTHPYTILAIQDDVRPDLIEAVSQSFASLGLQLNFKFVGKTDLIQMLLHRNYELALFSKTIVHNAARNLEKAYSRNRTVPFTKSVDQTLLDQLNDIYRTPSKSQRENKIYAFEQRQFEHPHFIPLFFQKSSYLVRRCLSLENATLSSDVALLQQVGQIPGCKE